MKCITFDKAAQDALPEHIKAKMRADRDKARLERTMKIMKETEFKDFYGKPICVGDTVMNFKLNNIVPKRWEVKERGDGLIYCEGEHDGQKKFIALEQLINTPGVALTIIKPRNNE